MQMHTNAHMHVHTHALRQHQSKGCNQDQSVEAILNILSSSALDLKDVTMETTNRTESENRATQLFRHWKLSLAICLGAHCAGHHFQPELLLLLWTLLTPLPLRKFWTIPISGMLVFFLPMRAPCALHTVQLL